MMRILIATDAWHPQVNGVVRTLTMVAEAAKSLGVEVTFLTPQSFHTLPMPGYAGLRIAVTTPWQVARLIDAVKPDAIHIATEGPIGLHRDRRHLVSDPCFASCPSTAARWSLLPLSPAAELRTKFDRARRGAEAGGKRQRGKLRRRRARFSRGVPPALVKPAAAL